MAREIFALGSNASLSISSSAVIKVLKPNTSAAKVIIEFNVRHSLFLWTLEIKIFNPN